jgi:predicted MPP superfamily phosphohydrolase
MALKNDRILSYKYMMENKLTRRDFLKVLWVSFMNAVLIAMGGAGYGMWIEPARFEVENVSLKLKRLSPLLAGIRIAQLSDIHMGGWMNLERLQEVVKIVLDQGPDIVLLTGDFVVGHPFNKNTQQALQDLIDGLSVLTETIPTFAVLGNHDYWSDATVVREMLATSGVIDLTNTVFTFPRNGVSLHLCGVDDVWEGDVRLDDVIADLDENTPAILLAHEPDFADTSAATGKFDLQISGHTHGGQIVLPFWGPPVLPYLGLKYPSGLYKVGEMYQYTNRGIGMGRISVRFNCPPEITLFTLESFK